MQAVTKPSRLDAATVRHCELRIADLKPLMEAGMGTRRMIGSALGASFAIALASSPLANATEVEGYSFTNAAQEVTQLFWLAETASACGWAAPDEATKFKLFALRFLSCASFGCQPARSALARDGA